MCRQLLPARKPARARHQPDAPKLLAQAVHVCLLCLSRREGCVQLLGHPGVLHASGAKEGVGQSLPRQQPRVVGQEGALEAAGQKQISRGGQRGRGAERSRAGSVGQAWEARSAQGQRRAAQMQVQLSS